MDNGPAERAVSFCARAVFYSRTTHQSMTTHQLGAATTETMPKKPDPIPVICTRCVRPFTLNPRAYERRVARYGLILLCERCLTDGL